MTVRKKGWIYVTIQFVLIAAIVVFSFLERKYTDRPHNYVFDFLAFIFLSIGALLFMISLMNFRQRMTANPVPNENYTLQTSGLYSKIRHPIYLAALILMLGCICFFSAYYTFILFVCLAAFFVIKMDFEERELSKKFTEYEIYKTKTNRLIPGIY
jgi:protein-S-isoprenylcysteine O-methyltransferase Ste14